MTGPLLALRSFEKTSQTSNGISVIREYARFDADGLLAGVCTFGVICAAAIPGIIVSHKLFEVFSALGIGVSVTSTIVLLPVISLCFVVDRRELRRSIVRNWRGWLTFHGLTLTYVLLYAALCWAIATPSKWAIRNLIDLTITPEAAWIPLLLVVASTLFLWTGIMVLFVYLLFVYARLLGHLTQWIVRLEAQTTDLPRESVKE